jgi:hypothetical protein
MLATNGPMPGRMDAAQASPMSARMAVSREQSDYPLVPRSVTTARTGCHGGLSESVPADEVDAATVLSHARREIPPDQVLAPWCRSRRRQCLRTRARRRIQGAMTGLRPGRWRPDHLHMNETPATARLRRAVRAVILAEDNRVLLCRFSFPHPAVPMGAAVVWAAPGGGIEPGPPRIPDTGPPAGHRVGNAPGQTSTRNAQDTGSCSFQHHPRL